MAPLHPTNERSITMFGKRKPSADEQAGHGESMLAGRAGRLTPAFHFSRRFSRRRVTQPSGRPLIARASAVWRNRTKANGWLITQAFTPKWLPLALRRPAAPYLITFLLQMVMVACTTVILDVFPRFPFPGLLTLLGVVLAALTFGPGPSLLATVLGALLLNFVVLAPLRAFSTNPAGEVVGFLLYLLVGIAIGLIAGQVERGRRLAQSLAEQVAAQASQTLTFQHEHFARERDAARARVDALEASRRQMDEFLGLASHELRTPLTVAMASVQIVRRQAHEAKRLLATLESQEPQEQLATDGGSVHQRALVAHKLATIASLLDRSEEAMARLNRLVSDLLDTSHIQAGRFEIHPQRCDLSDLLAAVVVELSQAWPDREIRLILPEKATIVEGDPRRLKQVAAIFLTNALKFGPPTRPVTLRLEQKTAALSQAERDERVGETLASLVDAGPDALPLAMPATAGVPGAWARISVSDEGPGLSPEQQERVWERFTRIEGIEQQEGSGAGVGLGLFIAHAIVERHGGRLDVVSASGQGATFWCETPMLTDTAALA